jgi:hypothetical protein
LYVVWFLLVSIFVLVAPLDFDGFSIWRTLGRLPGFSVIRDPSRIIYVYELVVALAAGLFLTRLPARSILRTMTTALAAVLIVAHWNRERFDFLRPVASYDRWVDAPIDVDPSCRSFFIGGASGEYMSRSPHMWALYNVDAVFIALEYSIPTLNGYSAWWPDGWDLANPQEPEYAERVARWIAQKALTGVCALDIDARVMRPYANGAGTDRDRP